jgi:hypothetical protein
MYRHNEVPVLITQTALFIVVLKQLKNSKKLRICRETAQSWSLAKIFDKLEPEPHTN